MKTGSPKKNPNDSARFVGKDAVTKDGEAAEINYSLDESKVRDEAKYDGLYAVCTDLLDDHVGDILKVSEDRWQIEECFRMMKTDFCARPVYVQRDDRSKAHFPICFPALLNYRLLDKSNMPPPVKLGAALKGTSQIQLFKRLIYSIFYLYSAISALHFLSINIIDYSYQ